MNTFHFTTSYLQYDQLDELAAAHQLLLETAHDSLGKAYAPYSGFCVSAAGLLASGQIICGTNQENASLGLTICAERTLLATVANLQLEPELLAIAVTARSSKRIIDSPITPCGACRQVISEFEERIGHPISILLRGETGPVWIFESIRALLPLSFSSGDLNG